MSLKGWTKKVGFKFYLNLVKNNPYFFSAWWVYLKFPSWSSPSPEISTKTKELNLAPLKLQQVSPLILIKLNLCPQVPMLRFPPLPILPMRNLSTSVHPFSATISSHSHSTVTNRSVHPGITFFHTIQGQTLHSELKVNSGRWAKKWWASKLRELSKLQSAVFKSDYLS